MPREQRVNASEVIQRELSRLGVARIEISEFRAQAELSEEEEQAFNALLKRKNEFIYVDAINDEDVKVMVGTFGGGE